MEGEIKCYKIEELLYNRYLLYCGTIYIIIIIHTIYFFTKHDLYIVFNLLICFSRSVLSCKPGMNFKTVIIHNNYNKLCNYYTNYDLVMHEVFKYD